MIEKKKSILNNCLGAPNIYGSEQLHYCPKCDSKKKKLSINLEKNVFKCWVCGFSGKSVSYLVKKYGSRSDLQNWLEASGIDLSEQSFDIESMFLEEEDIQLEPLKLPEEYIPISVYKNKRAKKGYKYLKSRGLSDHDITKWKIGFCEKGEYKDRVIIPSFDSDGNLNYFVSRATYETFVRYKNPKTSKDIIFNELMIDWSKSVVLVEGVFDSFKMENSIPILGSSFTNQQKLLNKIIATGVSVYIALDADAYEKSLKIYKTLSKYGVKTKIVVLSGNKDIGDMTKDKVEELYNTATDINSDNYLLYEIMKI